MLRQSDWQVTVGVSLQQAAGQEVEIERLIDVLPGHIADDEPLWGLAIDIGTTTVTAWLVDLVRGQVKAQASEYNGQIARGEDVISRILYASKNGGEQELHQLVLDTIGGLVDTACKRAGSPRGAEAPFHRCQIVKASISGNSTMMHLLLGIPAASIRLAPFVTGANHIPPLTAQEIGLGIHPEALVDCLPGVASYVGADITAGVLSSGMDDTTRVTLFMDVGTNGEIVLGSREWLVACACSAGPAFEGAGVLHGMRATRGEAHGGAVGLRADLGHGTVVRDGVSRRHLAGSPEVRLAQATARAGAGSSGAYQKACYTGQGSARSTR